MATIRDYTSGQVLRHVRMAFSIFDSSDGPLDNSDIGRAMAAEVNNYEPVILTMEQSAEYINNSSRCASGQRVCGELFPDTPRTESVFLDDLADGMVESNRARYVSKEQAVSILESYPKNPIVMSMVSGKYAEICRTFPEKCIYWNMEKRGLHCLKKPGEDKRGW